MLEQLEAWARGHEGGEAALESMARSVPFVRELRVGKMRAELRRRVDEAATKGSPSPWTTQEDSRLMAGMRSGEPVERTAFALRRTVAAVMRRRWALRKTYPRERWGRD